LIIDSNVLYGFEINFNKDLSVERVLELMEQKNIDRAAITNLQCKYYDYIEGNTITSGLVEKYPDKFIGMMSFHLSQYIDIEREIKRCLFELGLSGIRIFNTSSSFISEWGGGIDSYSMRKVLELVSGTNIPVFIEGGFPFITIGRLAEEFPEVPMITSGTGYGNMGEAIYAAKANKNIFLEISTLDTMDGIDVLVEELSADRIIFGTGMPYNSPSCEMLMVKSAKIADSDKEKIFSGNFNGILNNRRMK
jgi:predicted TIM-barrel fold metal-dependent hydrolase